MRYRVDMSSVAEEELREAKRYLEKHAPEYVSEWGARMRRAVLSLREMPHRCAFAPEKDLLGLELRQLLEGSYRIIFHIEGKRVRVLYIRHSAMQPLDSSGEE